jgi:hypothetical protein
MRAWSSRRSTGMLAAGAGLVALGLLGCPATEPPPATPGGPNLLTPDEPQRCEAGQDETASGCTPEGCLAPPDPEEGEGGADAVDCSRWDD